MFELKDFYDFCKKQQVDVIPFDRCPQPGATIRDGQYYAVFLDFTKIRSTRLLRAVCCHEMGHVATGALHKVDSPFETAERSEYRARRYVAQRYLTREEFQEAFDLGLTEPWQLEEYFDLPQKDILEALTYWRDRRGVDFSAQQ